VSICPLGCKPVLGRRVGGQVRPAGIVTATAPRSSWHPGLNGHHLRTEPVSLVRASIPTKHRQRTNPTPVRLEFGGLSTLPKVGSAASATGISDAGSLHRGAPTDWHDLACRSGDVLELQMSVIANSLQRSLIPLPEASGRIDLRGPFLEPATIRHSPDRTQLGFALFISFRIHGARKL